MRCSAARLAAVAASLTGTLRGFLGRCRQEPSRIGVWLVFPLKLGAFLSSGSIFEKGSVQPRQDSHLGFVPPFSGATRAPTRFTRSDRLDVTFYSKLKASSMMYLSKHTMLCIFEGTAAI